MAKLCYNGVLLPEIPADILAEFPYCWINSTFDGLIVAAYPWYYLSRKMYIPVSATNKKYKLSGDSWTLANTYTDTGGYTVNAIPGWSSHDVPNGSATATSMYLYGSVPIPEDKVSKHLIDFSDSAWMTRRPDVFSIVDGSTPFFVNSTLTYNGQPTFRSGVIGDKGTSETTINFSLVQTGSLEFNYIVSSEANYDWFYIYVDNAEVIKIAGSTSWTTYSKVLSAGDHTLKLKYVKDGGSSTGSDAGAIGYIKFIGVALGYEQKYLIKDSSAIYTISDNTLVALQESNLTADVFKTYGIDDVPEWSIISSLVNPEILYWQGTTDFEPKLNLTITATPLPQNVITNAIDLSDPTITGIELMTVNCEGNPLFAVSFDSKSTWQAWNGTEWSIVSEEFSGMTKELLESITYDQWMSLYTGASSFYIRVSFTDTETKLTEIYVDFAN